MSCGPFFWRGKQKGLIPGFCDMILNQQQSSLANCDLFQLQFNFFVDRPNDSLVIQNHGSEQPPPEGEG